MIIAGAGGHGLEVFEVLLKQGFSAERIYFFDEEESKKTNHPFKQNVITSEAEVLECFKLSPSFFLGVGNPKSRKKLDGMLTKLGGDIMLYLPFFCI